MMWDRSYLCMSVFVVLMRSRALGCTMEGSDWVPFKQRSFTSSECLALLERFLRSIAQGCVIDRRNRVSLPTCVTTKIIKKNKNKNEKQQRMKFKILERQNLPLLVASVPLTSTEALENLAYSNALHRSFSATPLEGCTWNPPDVAQVLLVWNLLQHMASLCVHSP